MAEGVFCKPVNLRILCILSACAVYAVAGSPTPSHLGSVEIMVGGLLASSMSIWKIRDICISQRVVFWQRAGIALLFYGLSVTLVVSVLNGQNIGAIFRDIVPFLFLFLPLLFWPILKEEDFYKILLAVVGIGLMFSVRSLLMQSERYCSFWCTEELLYLENMPTVLFSALFLIGHAGERLMRGFTIKNLVVSVGCLILALLPIAAMAAAQQRASLGAVILYLAILGVYFMIRKPLRSASMLLALTCFVAVAEISFMGLFTKLMHKTETVGLNMRPQEFSAVWVVVTQDIQTFIFGIGWGGQFHSPAVGNLSVNFTHNFFTSFLLKSGVCGMVLASLYMAGILQRLYQVVQENMNLGIALLAPILIDITLYASFKSLDFGLMLLISVGALVYFRRSNPESFNLSTDAKTNYIVHEPSLSSCARRNRTGFEGSGT